MILEKNKLNFTNLFINKFEAKTKIKRNSRFFQKKTLDNKEFYCPNLLVLIC